jgi:multisubunit Na+/H+ antiporter MnhB subunit
VAEQLPELGIKNPVTGVLLAYRAVDTLLESVVLVLALVAVWSLASDSAWGGRPASPGPKYPGSALTLLAQVLPPFGILVGVHILWVGADAPGGKFQGGVILAAMWVLVLVAGLRRPPALAGRPLRWLIVLGSLAFIAIGLSGVWLAGAFLAYPEGLAKPLILAIEILLTPSLAAILGLLLLGPPVADRGGGA